MKPAILKGGPLDGTERQVLDSPHVKWVDVLRDGTDDESVYARYRRTGVTDEDGREVYEFVGESPVNPVE